MKCAIVLLALVAVSQAAFTSRSLSQQARPILKDAVFKMRLASRAGSFRESELTNSVISTLEGHADALIAQIANALNHGQVVASNIYEDLQNTMANLQALGQATHGAASETISNFLQSFGNIFGNLFGGAGRSLSDLLSGLIGELDLSSLLENVLQEIFGQGFSLENLLAAGLGRSGLLSGVQGIFGQVSAASQQLFANLAATVQQISTAAQANFQQLQQLATQFAEEGLAQAQATVSQAATSFLDFLKPYQQDLGTLYDNVVAQVHQLVSQF